MAFTVIASDETESESQSQSKERQTTDRQTDNRQTDNRQTDRQGKLGAMGQESREMKQLEEFS